MDGGGLPFLLQRTPGKSILGEDRPHPRERPKYTVGADVESWCGKCKEMRAHHIVASFSAGGTANIVAFASRLENGHTLITDSGNARVVEVDAADNIVWQCATNTDPNSNPAPQPSRAIRLANGNTIISDQYNHRVFAVDRHCNIVANYGLPLNLGNNTGYGTNNASQGLNGPYDAKVIGDYTGLTPPHGHDFD